VIAAPACGWESLSEKIATDAKFGGTNIRKLSFTNAEGCGNQIRQFLTGVVGRHPTLRRTTAAGSGGQSHSVSPAAAQTPTIMCRGGLDANYVALSDSDLSGL
jgi:hypothetical protein